MTITTDNFRISREDGVWLCVRLTEGISQAMRLVVQHTGSGRLFDLTIAPHRKKRSLDANAYYWVLCGKLANDRGETPLDIYRWHVRDIGNYETCCMETGAVEHFKRLWTNGHLGRFTETRTSKLPGCTTVLAYYGSSDFDTGQMSRLIDNCVQDCKALGIETLPPDKLAQLKEEWGNAQRD